jgi:hypothetical protein
MRVRIEFILVMLAALCGCSIRPTDPESSAQPPRIASVAPNPAVAGALLTISGTSFGDATGTLTLRAAGNSVNIPVASWSDSRIIAAPPANVNTQPLYGRQGSLLLARADVPTFRDSTALTLNPPANFPFITAISATSGTTGNNITLTGINLGPSLQYVLQSTAPGGPSFVVQVVSATATQAVVNFGTTVPTSAYNFGVFNTGAGTGGLLAQTFTVLPDGPAPTLSPTQTTAQAGTAFVLGGTNLNNNTNTQAFLVQAPNVLPLTVLSAAGTQLLLSIPTGTPAGVYTLRVRTGNQTVTFSNTFTIDNATPAITTLLPNPVVVGGVLTVGGAGFNINNASVVITVRQFGVANPIIQSGVATAGGNITLVQYQLPTAALLPPGSYWVGVTHNGNTTFSSTQLAVQ